MVASGDDAWHLLHFPVDPLGPGAASSRSGRASGHRGPEVLFLHDRDLAARVLFRGRSSDHGGSGAVFVHQRAWPGLVRLCLPANGVDRPVHSGRALDRRGPQRKAAAASSGMERRKGAQARGQVDGLAGDRAGDRRGLGFLLHRRAHAFARSSGGAGASGGLHHHGDPDADDLCFRRLCAGTNLHLRLPMAAHSGGDGGRRDADHRLPRLEGRAARQADRGGQRRLHRLHGLRERLSDGHRHPRRSADGLHHLRIVHRRLQ